MGAVDNAPAAPLMELLSHITRARHTKRAFARKARAVEEAMRATICDTHMHFPLPFSLLGGSLEREGFS